MTQYTATYDPSDDKIRVYPARRLDQETYARVKGAGYAWAPKQECFFAIWSPHREDLALELAGEIDDEDSTLAERTEARAERFEDYSDHRAQEGNAANARVHAIMDQIPLGQPILVGHSSERHARADQRRIQEGSHKAVENWRKAEYWEQRAKRVLHHAAYKERPDVRARRIKGLEADLRKQQRNRQEAAAKLTYWSKEGLTLETARTLANFCEFTVCEQDGSRWSAWDVLRPDEERYSRCPAWTVAQVQAKAQEVYPPYLAVCDRWIAHLELRITYERTLLGESGGTVADQVTPEKGGACQCWVARGAWVFIQKVNKVSVTVFDNWGNGGANFTRTIPFDKLQGVMPKALVEELRAAGRLIERSDGIGFVVRETPTQA